MGRTEDAPEPSNPVSSTEPDWARERKRLFDWQPSRSLIGSIRSYQYYAERAGWLPATLRRWAVLRHRFWSIVTGADVPLTCRFGGGLMLPHPNGVVVHPDSRIGPNCMLFQQVTLAGGKKGAPRLGGHVDVGAGAKILGGVTVGDHACIGANAVVLDDVPAGATAVGIPARVVRMSESSPE